MLKFNFMRSEIQEQLNHLTFNNNKNKKWKNWIEPDQLQKIYYLLGNSRIELYF